jgi:hypothetical protein
MAAGRNTVKTSQFLLIAVLVASGLTTRGTLAQPGNDTAVAQVRQAIDAARKEIETYKSAGGVPAAADHPAVKWDAALWAYRDRYPRSDAAALASAEAIRLLGRAELWDRAHARADSLDADDPAWLRVGSPIYEEGIARKDLPYTIDRLSRIAAATTNPSIKASVSLLLGRAYRRHGDNAAATRAIEAAKSAAPGTPYAEEADGLLYEIKYLSVGMPAPPVSGKTRNGGTISLASLRGKPVVLVFWGTT